MYNSNNNRRNVESSIVHYQSRRGATLLLVLGLMTMFSLLIVTFMVVTTQARRAAETQAKIQLIDGGGIGQSRRDTESAFQKLLTGDNLESVIGPWSILEDLYGHPAYVNSGGNRIDVLRGTFGTMNTTPSGLWMFTDSRLALSSSEFDNPVAPVAPLELAGSVLTVKELGPNRQTKSFRIFEVRPDHNDCEIYVVPSDEFMPADFANCEYIINGAPFGGTGPGFVAAASGPLLTDKDEDNVLYALRPNILAPTSAAAMSSLPPNTPIQQYQDGLKSNLVMMNSDYTAADALHMFLAQFDVTLPSTVNSVIPSFHRPGLITNPSDPNLTRKTMLRPSPLDHPDFDGSNSNLDAANFSINIDNSNPAVLFPWDVDNDNDGIPDSIWIDAGLGTFTDPKTNKTYKKLAAFLVVDMDGRLNVNTHGNIAHTDPNFDPTGATAPNLDIRGGGSGPAEVRLDRVLPDILAGANLDDLLRGKIDSDTGLALRGRYGKESSWYDPSGVLPFPNDPRFPGDPALVDDFTFLDKALTKTVGLGWVDNRMGDNYFAYDYSDQATVSLPAAFSAVGGLPPDWWGQAQVAFDPLGNRQVTPEILQSSLYAQNPYLTNPYGRDGYDSPFSSESLESLLRSQGDVDFWTLPTELRKLLGETTFGTTSLFRHHLTTRSSDIPSPSRFMGVWNDSGTPKADWSIYRKVYRIFDGDSDQETKAAQLLNLLPEEIRQGLHVNLNRPSLSQHWVDDGTGTYNHETGLQERARFAQEIFYLLMVLNYDEIFSATPYDEGTGSAFDPSDSNLKEKAITRLAQWSVNLVDFMDPDATMTPFVFSTAPFTTADATTSTAPYDNAGDINTIVTNGTWTPSDSTVRLIWGMEKPEVAITETLATHNRRVADTTNGATPCDKCGVPTDMCAPTTCPSPERDAHEKYFNQVERPQGSLFVELYRKGDPERSHLPPELASSLPTPDDKNLDMAKRVGGTGDYIWRLAIGEIAQDTQSRILTNEKDLFNSSEKRSFQPGQWPGNEGDSYLMGYDASDTTNKIQTERYVFFGDADPATCPNLSGATGCSYWNVNNNPVELPPNTYLVIGPRDNTQFCDSEPGPPFGQPPASPGAGTTLTLSSLPPGPNAKLVMTMIASDDVSDISKGLNVSEPTPGAPTQPTVGLDAQPFNDTDELFSRGTIPCYRSIFLQRLADPSRAYNVVTNPYITVDWNMIDLHVFNSEKDSISTILDNAETNTAGTTITYAPNYHFAARQWGVHGDFSNNSPNLWDRNTAFSQVNTADLEVATKSSTTMVLSTSNNSLGYLNEFNGSATADMTTTGVYQGAPTGTNPFVHFAWNDSPFANALEVMQVPACSASTFGIQFHDVWQSLVSPLNPSPPQSLGTVLRDPSNTREKTSHRFGNETTGLGYLLGFVAIDDAASPPYKSLNLARFLDLVCVPSRFNGTIAGWTNDGKPIYAYQEPGKINLNTVTESAWRGLEGNRNNFQPYTALRTALVNSGYFRSSSSAELVPVAPPLITPNNETTLLRSADGTGTGSRFFNSSDPAANSSNMYNEYENVARLSSMTTNRSNVFAVWITVGYFEVEHSSYGDGKHPSHISSQAMFDAVYPDGYLLGKEKGIDDGTLTRHRAFYLIDRSIPVGFRRGEKLNSENVILLKRVLE